MVYIQIGYTQMHIPSICIQQNQVAKLGLVGDKNSAQSFVLSVITFYVQGELIFHGGAVTDETSTPVF